MLTALLSRAFGGEALGFFVCFLKNSNGGSRNPHFIRVSAMARQLRIDEFHPKQLIFHHFEESLSFFDGEFDRESGRCRH